MRNRCVRGGWGLVDSFLHGRQLWVMEWLPDTPNKCSWDIDQYGVIINVQYVWGDADKVVFMQCNRMSGNKLQLWDWLLSTNVRYTPLWLMKTFRLSIELDLWSYQCEVYPIVINENIQTEYWTWLMELPMWSIPHCDKHSDWVLSLTYGVPL